MAVSHYFNRVTIFSCKLTIINVDRNGMTISFCIFVQSM
uniref:Uncharacterized protein n=1 Tax=Myoviridae sp. ctcPl3 TaxID=2826669 RepID=A0A8S5QW07_9CAUD|nr:MAG TPA: protein of unknown function (DUF5395) [Myoviridae sp. ctcPl3]